MTTTAPAPATHGHVVDKAAHRRRWFKEVGWRYLVFGIALVFTMFLSLIHI